MKSIQKKLRELIILIPYLLIVSYLIASMGFNDILDLIGLFLYGGFIYAIGFVMLGVLASMYSAVKDEKQLTIDEIYNNSIFVAGITIATLIWIGWQYTSAENYKTLKFCIEEHYYDYSLEYENPTIPLVEYCVEEYGYEEDYYNDDY